jgi:hypothetical protein
MVPKSWLPGTSVTAGEEARLVPVRLTVCGLPGASSVIVTFAERNPGARGVNVTIIVQAELTAMAELHVGLEELSPLAFAPAITTLVMCSAAVPEFCTEIFSDALVPCATLPKSRLPGMSVTAGAGVRPVPFNGADSVVGEALLVIVTAAVRLPGAEGVKETRTEHELPGCKTVGTWQVSVSAKSWGFAPVILRVFKLNA